MADLLKALIESLDRAREDRAAAPTCAADDCTRPAFCKGLCRSHDNKARYDVDPERHRARQRAWYAANPEKAAAARARRDLTAMRRASARWYADNRLRAIASQANRRASVAGVPGVVTAAQLLARLTYFGNRCYLCAGQPNGFDHVKPLTAGGPNFASNLRPVCGPCNSRKGTSWKDS
jgi:5-methylcytosine-specific restriction endonuclease McrA